ncbi:MAG: acetyl-CoA C-acetyltransferase [Acidobacteria bacterium]|nr:acetyl-CoA C-acetyltransferase [Acidobacteriota bacterium]MBI3657897.1 acetyl-CoA C-acetyltransferase [Acidobacteriota bacterium]
MQGLSEVFIAGASRTPIGKFGGSLLHFTARDLGVTAAKAAMERAGVAPDQVEETIFGHARPAGVGPNLGRQIHYYSGAPVEAPAYTINKACGSGLKALILGSQEIALGHADIVLVGGAESMSRVPYLMEGVRWGARMGHQKLVDVMYRDGFLCPLSNMIMGETAEILAEEYHISRAEQDDFALASQRKAEAALGAKRFQEEIVPVTRPGKNGAPENFSLDEHVRQGVDLADLAKLSPVFKKDGAITAGNSSGLTDGAAALILISGHKAKTLGVQPQARIVDYAAAGVDPRKMGLGPVPAIRKLFDRRRIDFRDIDLIELNEAFAAQVIACDRELQIPYEKLNVNGGAIALGHPIGCTGARIVVTLVHEMLKRRARIGLATLCISGGMGLALLIENVSP